MFGSKLAIKLWETTAEKGIGALFKPWQIRREGIASLEMERKKMLVLAQTERDIEDIKTGKLSVSLNEIGNPKLIHQREGHTFDNADSLEPFIDIKNLPKALNTQFVANEFQKEINVAKSLLVAEEVLAADASEPTQDNIEDDWLMRWRESAATSSSEKLQDLWGRILAGELKSPGSYSLRTVEFLKNLTQKEAEKIQKLFSFILLGRVIKKEAMSDTYDNKHLDNELKFNFLSEMQSLGIITGVESMGLTTTFNSDSKDTFSIYHIYNDKVMRIHHSDTNKKLELNVLILTPLGLELKQLCPVTIDSIYLNYVIDIIKSQGFNISIGDLVCDSNGKLFSRNQVEV
ncbi:TPA: DUF2806 domain-containing protein [Citrobacter freundii]|nr:DUF2806 domain-containing protein [Citrobacter freundii]HEE0053082.1 DUF2806 domain-containing protein [Citrobacter freundii]